MRRVLALVALCCAVAWPAARADEACDAAVVDPAGALGSGRAAVDQSAARLAQTGPMVRVRVVEALGARSIDAWERTAERQCPAWTAKGARRADLLVVAVAVSDRKTGVWYGRDLAPALDSRWEAIESTAMNPRFKQGDVAGGLVAGLDALDAAVTSPPRPPNSGGTSTWAALAIAGGLVAAVGGGVFALVKWGGGSGRGPGGGEGPRRRSRGRRWAANPPVNQGWFPGAGVPPAPPPSSGGGSTSW